jgi:hypothetical protein
MAPVTSKRRSFCFMFELIELRMFLKTNGTEAQKRQVPLLFFQGVKDSDFGPLICSVGMDALTQMPASSTIKPSMA